MAACTWAEGAFIANSYRHVRLRMFGTAKLNQSFWEDFDEENVRYDLPRRARRPFAAGGHGAVRGVSPAPTGRPGRHSARGRGRISQQTHAPPREHAQGEGACGSRTYAPDALGACSSEDLTNEYRRAPVGRGPRERAVLLMRRRGYFTGQGFAPQMSRAYSPIVRSLENLPEPAMLRMIFCVHSSGLR